MNAVDALLASRRLTEVGADELPPRKEHAPCCVAQRDEHGRLPVGFCGAECIRRRSIWRQLVRAQRRSAARGS